ncbi:MAG: hypothetical protein NTY76_00405 [Candidatus Omnitrophica bacterium]|nr:hypothetical protein [Candidatus Omnitrophota bacterium]
MQKNIVPVLVVICIILISVLVISSSANGVKLKKAQAQVIVLNNTIVQKDAEIIRLNSVLQVKQQALDSMNREMENVKTELSNTVIRLQALPAAQKSAATR